MVISVQVKSGLGEVLSSVDSRDVGEFFLVAQENFPMLAGTIPWGDTVFNGSQIPVLLEELNRYEADPELNTGDVSFQWLRRLCASALEVPHRMLWFTGG